MNADGKLDIKFEPGSRYSYCGEGINVAQLVVEQALHEEVDAFLFEVIRCRSGFKLDTFRGMSGIKPDLQMQLSASNTFVNSFTQLQWTSGRVAFASNGKRARACPS